MKQGNSLSYGKDKVASSENEMQESRVKALVAPEVAKDKRKVMEPRSGVYMQAMSTVDDEKEELIEKVVKKMPLNNKLLGILSGCKIPGCIIHAIDKEGNILEHYQTENDIPDALQEGYQVYLQHAGCFSVEVYTMYYCVVYENGSVKFYERNLE